MGFFDLDADDKASYLRSLFSSHQVRTRYSVYDHNETFIGRPRFNISEATVDGDDTNDIARSLTFKAPRDMIWSPTGDLYISNFIGAEYGVYVDELQDWIWDDVFKGPVTKHTYDSGEHTIECSSKEVRMMPPIQQVKLSKPDGKKISHYIQTAAADYGEQFFKLGSFGNKKTPNSFNVNPIASKKGAWHYISQLALKAKYKLYYDRSGYLTGSLKKAGKNIVLKWPDTITAPVSDMDFSAILNRVNVYAKDQQGNQVLRGFAQLPSDHPFSKESLSRNGKPLILKKDIHSNSVHMSVNEANKDALNALEDAINNLQDVQFDTLPAPFLELGDQCAVVVGGETIVFTLRSYSLPMGPASMTVGYTEPKPTFSWTVRHKHG